MELKKMTRLSLLLALSVILNIVESFFPILNGMIPGVKLGLANIVILVVLYFFTWKDAVTISILRVVLVGMLRTGFGLPFLFSLSGSLFSVLIMSLAKKKSPFSIYGISLLGSVFHMIGQLLIAILFLKLPNLIYYVPVLMICAIPTGILIGYCANYLLEHFRNQLEWIEK